MVVRTEYGPRAKDGVEGKVKEAASRPLSVVGCPLSEGRDEVLRACREPGFGESAWDRAAQEEGGFAAVVRCRLSVV